MGAPLWTRHRKCQPHLSNGRYPLDTPPQISTASVHWALPFGHATANVNRICPLGAPLWTRHRKCQPHLSIGRSPLDTPPQISTAPVQWALPFGHDTANFNRTCPLGAPLWTRHRKCQPHLSIGRSPLDTTPQISTAPVQWALPFGHATANVNRTCPLGAPLWTRHRKFQPHLSNGRSPLDTPPQFSSVLVHWALPFGHATANFNRTCPLGAPLWTRHRKFQPHLSIGRSPLDTTPQMSTAPVQWALPFGHATAIFKRTCPLGAPLWTRHRKCPTAPVHWALPFGHSATIFKRTCPLGAPLWTRHRKCQPHLSIGRSPLDTPPQISSALVHWALPFGHDTANVNRTCPLGAPLWTLRHNFQAYLSIGRSPLDTTPQMSTAPVQWALPFGHATANFNRTCPMGAPLWTRHRKFQPHLSIGRSALDTTPQFSSVLVHWALPFGHATANVNRICPMGAPLWTRHRKCQPHLSIGRSPLDTTPQIPTAPVQWALPFGHATAIFKRTCPLEVTVESLINLILAMGQVWRTEGTLFFDFLSLYRGFTLNRAVPVRQFSKHHHFIVNREARVKV